MQYGKTIYLEISNSCQSIKHKNPIDLPVRFFSHSVLCLVDIIVSCKSGNTKNINGICHFLSIRHIN